MTVYIVIGNFSNQIYKVFAQEIKALAYVEQVGNARVSAWTVNT